MKLDNYKKDIEEYLVNYFDNKGTYNKLIYDAASYSLNLGGKRIRPILLILSYNLYKGNYKNVLPMAGAIEMIHTYSLIHDDLPAMDNDDLRRGKPTNHKVFGAGIATLAGDALLNEAIISMLDFSLKNGENALLASKEIAVAAGAEGMIGGQVVDILSETKESISEDELNYMHSKKTGELIRSAIVAGAILADAPKEDIQKLDEYGKKLGLAFQIKDDLLDAIGSVEKLGKNAQKDMEKNKCNYVTMYGIEKCEILSKKLTCESINLLNELTKDADYLKELTFNLLNREN
ncbi:polyprenyl synthetase family protein [Clostridium sp. SHJSY1]|uniref:polyprenyl synthetase family protein n=1 Tax=Clostridium sp. SHJSY1 TaxID=2942483 RepID=UPI0028741F56|nr:farnesyl diphosphate synthase [Clostridium sp. SHJSY1]MDS0527871.1 polyprenyl synthetase family protein [Clostridium sp. SHJSY1]